MKKTRKIIAAMLSAVMMLTATPAAASAYKVYPDIQSALEGMSEGAVIVDTYYKATDPETARYLVLTKECSLREFTESQPIVKVEFREGYGPEDIELSGDARIGYVDFEKLPENGREYLEALFGDKAGSGYYLSAVKTADVRMAVAEAKRSAAVREICMVTPLEQFRPFDSISRIAVNTDMTSGEFAALYPELGLIESDMQVEGYDLVFDLSNNIWPRMKDPGKAYDAMVRLVESGVEHRINYGMVAQWEGGDHVTAALMEVCTPGDANCNGTVDIADAVAVLQYMTNSEKYPMTAQGISNADIDGEDGLTGSDVRAIQMIDAAVWDE